MLAPSAVSNFLHRRFDSHIWLKDITNDELEDLYIDLHPRPKQKFPLAWHQKICFLLGLAYKEFYFQLDMGTGKTMLALSLLCYFIQIGKIRKAVVLVPTNEIVDGWGDEIQKWCPGIEYKLLKGSSDDKWDLHEQQKSGIVIVSYPGIIWLVCRKEEVKGRGKKKYKELVPKANLIKEFLYNVDALVFDETTKTGHKTALIYRVLNYMAKNVSIRFGLAGRVFGRDPMLAWAQFHLVDRGATFGKTIGPFREAFFTQEKNLFGGPYDVDYKFDKSREKEFGRMMLHRSITFMAEECIDLPPLIKSRTYNEMPIQSQDYYDRAIEMIRKSKGAVRECQNAFIRMRQISSGFIGFKDDDTGEKAQLEFDQNPKLDHLLDVVDRISFERKFIIAVDFTYSGVRISNELRKMKIQHGWLWGGTKDWPTMKKKFDTDPNFRGLIVQNKKGAYGLNLQAANYLLVYESPVSVLDREQLEKRCRRQGQIHKVFIYDFLTKDTVDDAILAFHKEGATLFEALVKDPQRVLRMLGRN